MGFRINLGDALVKKPIRWMFSQLFGSKTKKYFDENIAPIIDAATVSGTLTTDAAFDLFLGSDFIDKILKQATTTIGIDKKYEGIARDFIKKEIENQLKKKIK
jgi:hypothetical protein